MDESDIESSRSIKRRRLSGDGRTSSRCSSPDELAASSDRERSYERRADSGVHNTLNSSRRQSYRDISEDSADELNEDRVHTFYRDSRSRDRRSPDSPSSGAQSAITARSRASSERKPLYTNYRQKVVLKGHRRGVAAVKFSPDGRCIASCCESFIVSGGELLLISACISC